MTFPVKCYARIDQYRRMREEHLTGVTVITLCEAQEDHAAFYDLGPATTSPRHPRLQANQPVSSIDHVGEQYCTDIGIPLEAVFQSGRKLPSTTRGYFCRDSAWSNTPGRVCPGAGTAAGLGEGQDDSSCAFGRPRMARIGARSI